MALIALVSSPPYASEQGLVAWHIVLVSGCPPFRFKMCSSDSDYLVANPVGIQQERGILSSPRLKFLDFSRKREGQLPKRQLLVICSSWRTSLV